MSTNDIRSWTPQNIAASKVTEVTQQFKQGSRKTRVIISSLTIRSDNPEFANKVKQTNFALKLKSEENNWLFIDNNSNINSLHLNHRGLHLIHEGSALLQANIANILTSQDRLAKRPREKVKETWANIPKLRGF